MTKLADYQLVLTDSETGSVKLYLVLRESYGLKFERLLNDIGKFVLTLAYTDELYNAFTLDTIVDVQRRNYAGELVTESSYFIRGRTRLADGNDERLVVSGFHANHLLKRRYIDPADDSTQPNGGYATKAGYAATIMRDYIREQAADLASSDRQTVGLTVPVPDILGNGTGGNFRYENLWDTMVQFADTAKIDLEVQHYGNRDLQVIITRFGSDKTSNAQISAPYNFLIFSPNFGNLANPEYEEDRAKEMTVCTIKGSGARENQNTITLVSPTVSDTAYNRIEGTADARSTNEGQASILYNTGLQFFIKNRADFIFKGQPLLSNAGMVYRREWVFGDFLTMRWGDIEKDLRIKGITFEVDSGEEKISSKLEEE